MVNKTPENILISIRKYQKNNPDKMREINKRWRDKNPG